MKKIQILVDEHFNGTRIDKVLSTHNEIESRSMATHLIQDSKVSINNKFIVKVSHKVKTGELYEIVLDPPVSLELIPLKLKLDIVFEDESLIVVNKPAGLVVHPSPGHLQDSLVNALLNHTTQLSQGSEPDRPGIVHRLDKDTSGLIVIAKTDVVHTHLAQQFKQKLANRVYWAISIGHPKIPSGEIHSHIIRHPVHRQKMSSEILEEGQVAKGKSAITQYKVLQSHVSKVSWIECKLKTGRTHQIRVHLMDLLCPILGDELYGSKGRIKNLKSTVLRNKINQLNRVALHAHKLELIHPVSSELISFQVDWPEDLMPLVEQLKFNI